MSNVAEGVREPVVELFRKQSLFPPGVDKVQERIAEVRFIGRCRARSRCEV